MDEIRGAYSARLKELRNSLGAGQSSADYLDALRDAYRVLSSPELRAEYDAGNSTPARQEGVDGDDVAGAGHNMQRATAPSRRRLVRALTVVLAVSLLASAVFGGWLAWDRGYVPGNPRAATVEVMEPIVRRAAVMKSQQRTVCVSPELERAAPEIQGVPGIVNRTVPGQHSLILLLETHARDQDVRERQLRQLSFFAKQGFFSENDLTVDTDAGSRAAKQFQLTWQGYGAMQARGGNTPCFVVGDREFNAIQTIEKRNEDVFGMEIYEVAYETAVMNVSPWASSESAKALFPKLAGLISPKREMTRLLRGNEGWVTEMEAQRRSSLLNENSAGAAAFAKQMEALLSPPPAPDPATVRTAFSDYLNGDQWLGRGTVACMSLRLQRGGDDREAANDRSSYRVVYHDQAGRPEYQRTQMMTALHLLSALEIAGLAQIESLPPPSPTGPAVSTRPGAIKSLKETTLASAVTSGVRFVLRPDAVQALGLNGSACIPVGRMKVEFLGTQYAGNRAGSLIAYAKVTQTPDWVVTMAEHLPAVRSVIENGIPLNGMLGYADDPTGSGQGKRWRVTSLGPSYPEMQISSVPRSMQDRFPVTVSESTKVPKSGVVGSPTSMPLRVTSPLASAPVDFRIPAPVAVPLPAVAANGSAALPKIEKGTAPYAAGDLDVHAISVYEGNLLNGEQRGFQQHPEGVVEIRLGKTGSPAMLLLSSYEPNEWRITLEPGANLGKVLAYGHYPQRVLVNGRHKAEIFTPSREAMPRAVGGRILLPNQMEANQMRDVADLVRSLTGKLPTSFQAQYRPKSSFSVEASTPPFSLPAPISVASLGAGDVVLKGSSHDPVTVLEVKYGNVGAYTPAWASRSYSSGRIYFEGNMAVTGGLVSEPHANIGVALAKSGGGMLDDTQGNYAVIPHGQQKIYRNGDNFGLALDLDAGMAYVRINGDWVTGAPGSGNGRALKKGREYVPYFYASAIGSGAERLGQTSWVTNFGASSFRHPLPKGYSSYDGRQKAPL
ncbi:MAG: hypothetical protein IPO00_14865 [Betaproteobacteria bacterium]|nr:hypothetical protein [Betaproteobacteria bacterium]